MKRLDGKVALITGGTKGIGTAIVRTFVSEGANVAFLGRSEELGRNLVKELNQVNSENVIFLKADMAVKQDLKASVQATEEKFGKIDILVNNAGIFPASPFLEIEENEVDKVFDVNQKGLFLITQLVSSGMASRNHGCIINITSIQGLIGIALQAHYSATKGALVGLTRALAAELGQKGIRVNAIAPGAITTETLFKNIPQEVIDLVRKDTPLGRLATAEDVAACALFLASDEANAISGAVIPVDGGYSSCRIFQG